MVEIMPDYYEKLKKSFELGVKPGKQDPKKLKTLKVKLGKMIKQAMLSMRKHLIPLYQKGETKKISQITFEIAPKIVEKLSKEFKNVVDILQSDEDKHEIIDFIKPRLKKEIKAIKDHLKSPEISKKLNAMYHYMAQEIEDEVLELAGPKIKGETQKISGMMAQAVERILKGNPASATDKQLEGLARYVLKQTDISPADYGDKSGLKLQLRKLLNNYSDAEFQTEFEMPKKWITTLRKYFKVKRSPKKEKIAEDINQIAISMKPI